LSDETGRSDSYIVYSSSARWPRSFRENDEKGPLETLKPSFLEIPQRDEPHIHLIGNLSPRAGYSTLLNCRALKAELFSH